MNDIIKKLEKSFLEIDHCLKNSNSINLGNHINSENKSGDNVKRIDILSNEILKKNLELCKEIKVIGSEEESKFYHTNNINGSYLICYDPLDGSSNIDVNITTGTIFALYKYDENNKITNGNQIIMSGYCLYGSATQYLIAKDNSLNMYQYFPNKNSFEVIINNLNIKDQGNIYSINESNKNIWDDRYNTLIKEFTENNYSARWVGSLVADAHRTLIKGGIFIYPGNKKNKNGKIRLLYEAYPFAHIFKIAGGESSNGECNLLDITFPNDLHKKTPIILSGKYEMSLVKKVFK